MATITVSLPERMKDWVEEQARTGRFEDPGDYVRDLIAKDEDSRRRFAELQTLIDEGFDSGVSARSRSEVLAEARAMAGVDTREL